MSIRPISSKPPFHRVALLACLTLVAACGGGAVSVPDFRGSPAFRSVAVFLDVDNLNYADVVIYGSRGGSWTRIGGVTGNTSERFEIPSQFTDAGATLSLRVHAIGAPSGADYVTGRIVASGGDVVALKIAPVLRMSSWSLR